MPKQAPTTKRESALSASSSAYSSGSAERGVSTEATAEELAALLASGPVVVGCDSSLAGILSAVGLTYLAHAAPSDVRLCPREACQPRLDEQAYMAPPSTTDSMVALAERVFWGFSAKTVRGHGAGKRAKSRREPCSPYGPGAQIDVPRLSRASTCAKRVVLAAANDSPTTPEVIHRYMRAGFACGPALYESITLPEVHDLMRLASYVATECEHTRQFVRMAELEGGSYGAVFSPNANTLPLCASYFCGRMRTDRFFVIDPVHLVAIFHEAGWKHAETVVLDRGTCALLEQQGRAFSQNEQLVQELWRRFYRSTELAGRSSACRGYDLRAKWMPKRFWPSLTELT